MQHPCPYGEVRDGGSTHAPSQRGQHVEGLMVRRVGLRLSMVCMGHPRMRGAKGGVARVHRGTGTGTGVGGMDQGGGGKADI